MVTIFSSSIEHSANGIIVLKCVPHVEHDNFPHSINQIIVIIGVVVVVAVVLTYAARAARKA